MSSWRHRFQRHSFLLVGAAITLAGCGDDRHSAVADASAVDAGAAEAGGSDGGDGPAAGDAAAAEEDRGACSEDGWCWFAPWPQGNTLRGVVAASMEDVWVVGDHGTVVHHDGSGWKGPPPPPTREALNAAALDETGRLWVVGNDGTILVYDRAAWTSHALEGPWGRVEADLTGVWAAAGSVWVSGHGGVLARYDGLEWELDPTPTETALNAVWASDTGRAWAVGRSGSILHFDGSEWIEQSSGVSVDLFAVHGTSGGELWAAGAQGVLLRFEDDAWQEAPDGEGEEGWRPSVDLFALAVESESSVWAFGADDAGLRWNGARWVERPAGTAAALYGAWSSGGGAVIAVGERGTMVIHDDEGRVIEAEGSLDNHLAIAGNEDGELHLVGDVAFYFNGDEWQGVSRQTERSLYAVSVTDTGGALAVGAAGTILGWQSPGWEPFESGTDALLRGVWTDGSSGWAVGGGGTLLGQLTRASWAKIDVPTSEDLLGVWGAHGDAVWAVGAGGTILVFNGTRWIEAPPPVEGPVESALRAVWGTSAEAVWAVGTAGTILHFDGGAWHVQASGERYSLNAVWGTGEEEVWAVGTGGIILRYDGVDWAPEASGTGHALNGVWGGQRHVWVVGDQGTVLRRRR